MCCAAGAFCLLIEIQLLTENKIIEMKTMIECNCLLFFVDVTGLLTAPKKEVQGKGKLTADTVDNVNA